MQTSGTEPALYPSSIRSASILTDQCRHPARGTERGIHQPLKGLLSRGHSSDWVLPPVPQEVAALSF